MPPSDNHLYINVMGRTKNGILISKRAMSNEANIFKTMVKKVVARAAIGSPLSFREDIAYSAKITLNLDLFSRGFPKKAKSLFKKIDTSNRTKLLLDSICEAIGVDDKHIVHIVIEKIDSDRRPTVTVEIEELWDR